MANHPEHPETPRNPELSPEGPGRQPAPENAAPPTPPSPPAPVQPPAAPDEVPEFTGPLPQKEIDLPPKPLHSASPAARRLHTTFRVLKEIGLRSYAFLVLLMVLVPSLLALAYLYKMVFVPTPVPKRFLEWQGNVDVAALRKENVPGVTGPAARAPIAHYHKVDRWFQTDPTNGCTLSGCHEPLPHATQAKVPAFANFHTTFLACQMCHTSAESGTASVGWINLGNGAPQNPPPLLSLLNYLEMNADEIRANPAKAHQTIVTLLRAALAATGPEPALQDLLLHFETADPGSPVWRRTADQAMVEVPTHARGDYGAKLARNAAAQRQTNDQLAKLAAQYFKEPSRRSELHRAIHGSLLKEPLACVSCHGQTPAAIDLAAAGYSPRRIALLSRLQLASLMQQIREGKQFHLFRLMGDGNEQK